MTRDEKKILLKDLCSRLPYGVKVNIEGIESKPLGCKVISLNVYGTINVELIPADIEVELVKPYLRPISSMTEEEAKELEDLFDKIDAPCWVDTEYGCVDFADGNDFIDTEIAEVYTDWLNKKMFAYRTIDGKDMFELGLAIEATKDMYEI